MNRRGIPSHSISGLFVFMLLGIFALFSTVLVLLGAKAYQGTVDRSDFHNNALIASSYIRSMLRADDESDALRVEDLDGITSVTMLNTYDEDSYVTRIYVYDGMLREWFTEADVPFEPEHGETVCAAESMEAEFDGGLLKVKIVSNGVESEIIYAPRAGSSAGGAE